MMLLQLNTSSFLQKSHNKQAFSAGNMQETEETERTDGNKLLNFSVHSASGLFSLFKSLRFLYATCLALYLSASAFIAFSTATGWLFVDMKAPMSRAFFHNSNVSECQRFTFRPAAIALSTISFSVLFNVGAMP